MKVDVRIRVADFDDDDADLEVRRVLTDAIRWRGVDDEHGMEHPGRRTLGHLTQSRGKEPLSTAQVDDILAWAWESIVQFNGWNESNGDGFPTTKDVHKQAIRELERLITVMDEARSTLVRVQILAEREVTA